MRKFLFRQINAEDQNKNWKKNIIKKQNKKKNNYSGEICDWLLLRHWRCNNQSPPPDETHGGVEIVVGLKIKSDYPITL